MQLHDLGSNEQSRENANFIATCVNIKSKNNNQECNYKSNSTHLLYLAPCAA